MDATGELISVIVPVYQVEAYLPDCLDSILAQTYRNLEIILVDDGSKDRSGAICDEYAGKDSRIRVIHRENGGLSAARNTGMEAASGDLFMFIDSDDLILPEMAETLHGLMKRTGAAIAECGFYEVSSADHLPPQPEPEKTYVREGEDCVAEVMKNYYQSVVQWNKLYRRSVFDHIRYPEGRYHEDEYVIHRELAAAGRIVVTNRKLYVYLKRPGAITSSGSSMRKFADAAEGLWDRLVFLDGLGYKKIALGAYCFLLNYLSAAVSKAHLCPDAEEYLPRVLKVRDDMKKRFPVYEARRYLSVRLKRAVRRLLTLFR